MNPMTWRREHQVALVLGLVLGIVLGLVVGFCTEAFATQQLGPLEYWKPLSMGCPGCVCRRLFNLYSTAAARHNFRCALRCLLKCQAVSLLAVDRVPIAFESGNFFYVSFRRRSFQ